MEPKTELVELEVDKWLPQTHGKIWNAAIQAALLKIPGGNTCDPQDIADEIRELMSPKNTDEQAPMKSDVKTETVELEMDEWPRETLEFLIQQSCDKDISVNDVICEILKNRLENPAID